MIWKKYTIETTTEAEDSVAYMLGELGIDSVEFENLIPVDDEIQGGTFEELQPDLPEDNGISRINFYLEEDANDAQILSSIKESLMDMSGYMNVGSCTITQTTSDEADWRDNWKEFFSSFSVDNVFIKPTWEDTTPSDNQILVEIDPGVAFGTGKHESTQLIIKNMQDYDFTGKEVLDLGFGSGILSIVALKLGAKHVAGTDIDPDCIGSVYENFETNNLSKDLGDFYIGNLSSDEKLQEIVCKEQYDMVFANILADIIISMKNEIPKTMKKDAILFTSGIINFKEEEVKEALLSVGLTIVDVCRQGEWVSIIAKK